MGRSRLTCRRGLLRPLAISSRFLLFEARQSCAALRAFLDRSRTQEALHKLSLKKSLEQANKLVCGLQG